MTEDCEGLVETLLPEQGLEVVLQEIPHKRQI